MARDRTDTRRPEGVTEPAEGPSAFKRRVAGLRWIAPAVLFLLAAVHQLVLQWLFPRVPATYHFWLAVGLFGLSGTVVVWLALDWLAKNAAHQERTEAELRAAYDSLAEIHRQLLAVHDIGREIATADDMQEVLELAVRAPVQLAGAQGAAVVTWDDVHQGESNGRLKLDMAWGLSDNYLLGLRQRMEAGVPAGRCRGCDHLTARVSGDCPLFAGMQDLAQAEGIQSLVCLPISGDQKREGIISAYFPSPDGPPEEQVQLLNIVATEIAAALDGVRWRSSQMTTLYEVEHLGEVQHDLDHLLRQILDTTLAGWGSPAGAILLYDETEDCWHPWAQRGLTNGPVASAGLRDSPGDDLRAGVGTGHPRFDQALHLAEMVRQSRQLELTPDLAKDAGGAQPVEGSSGSAAAAPLLIGEELLGTLVIIAEQPDHFRARQAPFFQALAHQAALAINNARLHAQVQQVAILEERYRLSREMHDGLAQTLSALGWRLDHMKTLLSERRLEALGEELALGWRMVREAYVDVREAIDGLRLEVDHAGELASALEEYVAEFEMRTGLEASLELEPSLPPLPAETELQLLRIVQEALINIRKHARAGHVWVRLQSQAHGSRVTLTMADDGQGFDPALPRGRGHLGLATMRERAQSQDGDFAVVTGPGQGTRITVSVPLERVAYAR